MILVTYYKYYLYKNKIYIFLFLFNLEKNIVYKILINNKGTLNLITYSKNNINESESTKFNNTREMKIININQNYKKITLNIF